MSYIRVLLPIVLTVVIYCLAVIYTTRQTLEYLEEAPTCFPPYFLMKGEFGVSDDVHTNCQKAVDDGLRPHDRLSLIEFLRTRMGDPK